MTIDVSRVPPSGFLFAPSPLAELASAVHLLVEPTHHPAQNGWATAVAANVDPGLLDRLIDADYLWRTSRADSLLPSEPQDSLAAELDEMDLLDDETWVSAALLTSSCGTVPLYRNLGSPLVDPEARELARTRAATRGERQSAFVDLVLKDPPVVRSSVRRMLEDCDEAFFADAWSRVRPALVADARRKRDVLGVSGLREAVASTSAAITVDDDAARLRVDKLQDSLTTADERGMTFLPSVFGHPHLLVVHAPGWRPVVQYPVAGGAPSAPTVSVETVQQRFHALDNPLRLRLARSLLRAPHTTADLAEAWGVSASEVSRHLGVLKEAGLVTSVRHGRRVLHELDLTATTRIGQDLVQALLR
ncbi:transcriptional regulator [Luteimicrobium album]|uniref:Transcriptional regulator n=1 Tax=Luteimicrobium album TaxID=1054550 RepID=A0ABQ6I5H9_9MICO|nr:transcriptional regulator [Luteimicrobium album]